MGQQKASVPGPQVWKSPNHPRSFWAGNPRDLIHFHWANLERKKMDIFPMLTFRPSCLHELLDPTVEWHIFHSLVDIKPEEYITNQSITHGMDVSHGRRQVPSLKKAWNEIIPDTVQDFKFLSFLITNETLSFELKLTSY